MAKIVDRCQALVDEHLDPETATPEQLRNLMPNAVIGHDGTIKKKAGSILPDAVLKAINKLSYEFMDSPGNVAKLGGRYYQQYLGK